MSRLRKSPRRAPRPTCRTRRPACPAHAAGNIFRPDNPPVPGAERKRRPAACRAAGPCCPPVRWRSRSHYRNTGPAPEADASAVRPAACFPKTPGPVKYRRCRRLRCKSCLMRRKRRAAAWSARCPAPARPHHGRWPRPASRRGYHPGRQGRTAPARRPAQRLQCPLWASARPSAQGQGKTCPAAG